MKLEQLYGMLPFRNIIWWENRGNRTQASIANTLIAFFTERSMLLRTYETAKINDDYL